MSVTADVTCDERCSEPDSGTLPVHVPELEAAAPAVDLDTFFVKTVYPAIKTGVKAAAKKYGLKGSDRDEVEGIVSAEMFARIKREGVEKKAAALWCSIAIAEVGEAAKKVKKQRLENYQPPNEDDQIPVSSIKCHHVPDIEINETRDHLDHVLDTAGLTTMQRNAYVLRLANPHEPSTYLAKQIDAADASSFDVLVSKATKKVKDRDRELGGLLFNT